MKNYTIFNFDYLFSDHMAKISNQAKLYYIKLNFYANNGFVANPISVLDSLGYDKSVYYELVHNEEILTLEGRSEVFITAYFIHNKNINHKSWLSSPFAQYWKGKLWTKPNGVCTFKPQGEVQNPLDDIVAPCNNDEDKKITQKEWDELVGADHVEEKQDDDDLPF